MSLGLILFLGVPPSLRGEVGASEAPDAAGATWPPELPGAQVEVYKRVGDVALNMYLFFPPDHDAQDRRSAVVFFFGGGWSGGTPAQFQHHCRYFAERGMVAMAADYRVRSRHQTPARVCVADARSAVRWIRREAARLGVDPQRVVASGGSAGGHIAACTALMDGFDEPGEDVSISARPDALVLFNPVLVLAPVKGQAAVDDRVLEHLRRRLGVEPSALSPYHHVRAGAPPTIVFHGRADERVRYGTAEAFAAAMRQAGNRCELHGYEGQGHGFFNQGRSGNHYYKQTVQAADEFLTSLGFLPEPGEDSRR